MATAKEFVEFWLENSVHPDEQFAVRRGQPEVEELVRRLLVAAESQGFTRQQIEVELGGDISAHIRESIESQNTAEDARRKLDRP